jgi:hypothetical protein
MATSTERMRRLRRRRRWGMQFVMVEISEEATKLLEKQGYLETRSPASMGLAITTLLSDWVLDAA